MKKFTFPLDRVLDFRRGQARIEETKLERLNAELRAIETRLRDTEAAREESGRALIAGGSATGTELAALDSFRKASTAECAKLGQSAAAARHHIDAQLKTVIQKRRDVKLLEHLRSRKLEAWTTELGHEIDREASELYLSRFQQPVE